RAQLYSVGAFVDGEDVVQLEVLVVPGDERRRISDRAVEPTSRDLRIAHVARIAREPLQAHLAREIDATIEPHLSAVDQHPSESELVQPRCAEDPRVTGGYIERVRAERTAKTGHERFLKRARPEGLKFVCIERAETAEQLIA